MLLDEKISALQNLTKQKISYERVAKVLGLGSKQAAYNRVTRKTPLKDWEEAALDDEFLGMETRIDKSITSITLDYYPDIEVSCGNGLIPFGGTKETITVPTNFINGYSQNKKYFVVNAISDSMMPEIKPKDLLILRQIDNEPIIDNHIYVFCYDERLYCKYLSYNVGQVIVRSANKDYPIRYIEGEKLETFSLLGEVCGHFRNYLP